jgi:mannose-6-phosphate isomerase class I
MASNYDKHPCLRITSNAKDVETGWRSIMRRLQAESLGRLICIECYPGVFEEEIRDAILRAIPSAKVLLTRTCLKTTSEMELMIERDLSEDPVFGRLSSLELIEFFDQAKLNNLAVEAAKRDGCTRFVVGTGATLAACQPRLLIYADLARWEIQQRQRRGEIGNLGANNAADTPARKYKRGFFVDWRAADRLKKHMLPQLDFLVDTNIPNVPQMISGDLFRHALDSIAKQPFRVVPFFDPGPWGGEWMREVCDLPKDAPNYAWCFDCVPEENSLLLGFGDTRIEVPAIDLVFSQPRELLGDAVHARFGPEFPIRFDFLDTMKGGNLSLQVHPLTEYIQQHFGMHYTQDESYYLLDASHDACVYLGLRENINRTAMVADLRAAQQGELFFPADRYVNRWPARKHDHFLIPAGTIHCSGKNSMVLEISATPYIFTFKLWDWERVGLDSRPRPIHLEHGIRNIQWDRSTTWVKRELMNRVEKVAEGEGWHEECTGLHEREFIETRRHWFTEPVTHDTRRGVNVLNLVEGPEVIVESKNDQFEPLTVHYAETFIVPASVGEYQVRPASPATKPFATIKAFVRTMA